VAFQFTDSGSASVRVERRTQHIELPPCPECRSTDTSVATRTDYVVYARCADCGFVWSIPKPGQEAVGS
jgi:Zn ribbon nucleic-acid-binding protein